MRTLIIAALIAGSSPAYAWDSPESHAKASAHSSAHSSSTSSANASSKASGGAANANGAVSVDTERSTAAPALGGLSSGICAGASGGMSLGFLPFGGGANYGSIDPQCTLRNNILIVEQFNRAAAWEMLKGLDGYNEAVARLQPEPVVPKPKPKPDWCHDPDDYQKFHGDLFCK